MIPRLTAWHEPFMKYLPAHIFLLMVALACVAHAQQQEQPPSVFVVTEQAVKKFVSPTVLYSATVISRNDANLAGEISGHLTWVAEVGDRFRKGALVAKLDDVFIRQEVIEEQSTIQSEQARYEFYTKTLERFRKLLPDDNISRSQVDQASTDQSVARSNIHSARARLAQAEERLKRTNILAPFDGVVSERFLQAGEWADMGDMIVRLVSLDDLEIQTHVPASTLQFVTEGTPLNYTDRDSSGTGKVRIFVPVGGDVSRLYELRIAVSDPSLEAGNLLRVAIPTAHPQETVLVPRDALVLRREGVHVFRVNEASVAEKIPVQTGVAESGYIEVLGDIREHDRVVVRGGEYLAHGMPVSEQPSTASP